MQQWIDLAREHWKEWLPKKYAALKVQGDQVLNKALYQAASQTAREVTQLEDSGLTFLEAWEMTRETYLLLKPEVDNTDEEETESHLKTSNKLNKTQPTQSQTLSRITRIKMMANKIARERPTPTYPSKSREIQGVDKMSKVSNKLLLFTIKNITNYYNLINETGKEDQGTAKFIEGLITSVLVSEIISKDELQLLIDKCHVDIFGVSRKERIINEALGSDGDKWDYFEVPTILRK